jgi:hypothetical protein
VPRTHQPLLLLKGVSLHQIKARPYSEFMKMRLFPSVLYPVICCYFMTGIHTEASSPGKLRSPITILTNLYSKGKEGHTIKALCDMLF